MINKNSGQLTFGNGKTISPTTVLSEIKAFKLSEVVEESEFSNGWIHYTVRNVEAFGEFYHLTFSFDREILKSIQLAVNSFSFDLSICWNSWSEQRERENALFYNNWLNKKIGTDRYFTWGNVWAGYNPKSGGSSIFIRYN